MGCVVGFAPNKLDAVAGVGQRTKHIDVGLGCYKADVADGFDRKVDIEVGLGQDSFGIADCTGFRMEDVVHAIAIDQTVVLVRRLLGSIQSHLLHPHRKKIAYGPETPKKNDVYVFCLSFLACRSYPSLTCCHQASHQLPRLRDSQRRPLHQRSDPQL